MKVSLDELMSDLESKIKTDAPPEEIEGLLEEIYSQFRDYHRRLADLLKLLDKARGDVKLPKDLKRLPVDALISSMKKVARKYFIYDKNAAELRSSFEKQAYRLLEYVRAGRREEVLYLILRTLLANNATVYDPLLEAFSPELSDSEFKAVMFAFLGVLFKTLIKEG